MDVNRHLRLLPLFAALAVLAACGPATKPAPVRLVELGAELEGEAAASELPEGFEHAALGRGGEGARVARLAMSEGGARGKRGFTDNRLALVAPSGTRYSFRLKLPADPVLQVGLGYLPLPEPGPARVRFEVRVEQSVVFDETLRVHPDARWQDREISLARWAHREVTLELLTHSGAELPRVWAAWSAPEVFSGGGREQGWDIVLVSLDTVRADHLGCYGHDRPTSPAIDALAARGVRFETAVTQSPWTRPSHRSMLTGLYPMSRQGLSSAPLAEVLWRAGYRTWAVTGGGQIHPRFGFQRGFEAYRVEDWLSHAGELADRFLAGRGRKQLLFVHTYEIHDPYTHATFAEGLPRGRLGEGFSRANRDHRRLRGNPTDEERAYVEALYDSGIAFTDERLGRLLARLEEGGALERAIVVVTSDHGEQFWEHGSWRHGQYMFDHQLLVPLVVYLPPALRRQLGGKAERPLVVARQVRLVDLYPTLLDLLGVALDHPVQGRSLVPLLAGGSLPEVDSFSENTNVKTEKKALRSSRFKLIHNERRGAEWTELYDLRRDPGEQEDLAAENPRLVAVLLERLRSITEGGSVPRDEELPDGIDPELREQLEALGYLGER